MTLKNIPRRLAFILGAQWTRDAAWAAFTILLARKSPDTLGQIVLALTYGYLVKTVADIGLNDYLLSTFARREAKPRTLLAEVSWLKLAVLLCALAVAWLVTGWQHYNRELRLIILCIAGGLGMDAVADSFFALLQARGRQDVEMRIRIPSALLGLGYGIFAVWMDFSPLAIALFKPAEAFFCIVFIIFALGGNPLSPGGKSSLGELFISMKSGIIFTGMAACAMFYNKINVIFLKKYGGNAEVGGYGVAWETIEGLSVLVSSALLGKVVFPLLAKLWKEDKEQFKSLASQTAKTLWAAAMPLIYLIWVESDRFLVFIYGPEYASAAQAQRFLTPCLATAFLHNLAAYAMIGMQKQKLLFAFYLSGLIVNLVCCFLLIPSWPLPGTALALTITKIWVAILTVSFFQIKAKPMSGLQWLVLVCAMAFAFLAWHFLKTHMMRELAEGIGLIPLLILFWFWRPPSLFEKSSKTSGQGS